MKVLRKIVVVTRVDKIKGEKIRKKLNIKCFRKN